MDDRFEFIRLIGKGSTGGVYEAVCKSTDLTYSVRRFFSDDGKYRTGWEEEFLSVMKQLSAVRHPNVVPVIDAALDDDGAYMVTEFHPTSKLVEAYPNGMDHETFLIFADHSLGAFKALHDAEIVHGRLSYDSFLISFLPQNQFKFTLKDYGLRRIAPMIQGVDPSTLLPTNPIFIAPELFDTAVVDERTDLYMLGQLYYILLAGFHPMSGKDVDSAAIMHFNHDYKTLHQQDPEIPKYLSDWVNALTQPIPEERPASVKDALNLLQAMKRRAMLVTAKGSAPRKLAF